jgi:diacylglycerol kinase family enzyme
VIACGGDGTIHEVATGLAFSPIPLAILPAGTANVLARELDVPRDVMKAADLVPTLKQRRIALGKCGDDYFLLMAGAGLDAAAIQRVTSRSKRHLGRGAFWLAGFRHWCSGCFPQLSVTVDGATYTGTFAVASRVRGYGGRYQITPTAGLFLDRLTVCLFRGGSRTAYLRYLAGVLSKRHVAFHDVLCISGDTVEISSREPVPIQLDGELRGFTPVKLEIVRNALTLLVPRHLPY